MKIRTIAISLSVMLLATLLVPVAVSSPVQAQSQTSWYVNDNPTLFGPQQFWFHGASGHGYGTNNYRYTYATGGDPSPNNWARWNMGSRVGRQEIQVYIPSNHATATVNYNVTIGGSTSKVRVAQNGTRGWHSLGNWNTNGANVVVAVYDNDAEHHHERNGLASSSIGVDAIAMICVSSNCGSTPPPTTSTTTTTTTTTTTAPNRSVTVSLGNNLSGCPDQTKGCRQLITTLVGFSTGTYSGRCMWGQNATSVTNTFHNFTVRVTTTGQTLRHNPCNFNGTQGRYLTVIYDNVRSNTIRFSGTASGEVDTPAPERPPSEPRNVNADAHSTRQLRVTWSAPSNSGSAAIKHYTVRYSRPAIGTSGPWQSRLYTTTSNSHTSPNLRFGTTYTVAVTAVNRDDRASNRATDTATTPGTITTTGTIPTEPRNVSADAHGTTQLRVTWSPPSNSGSAPISHYTVRYSRPAIGTLRPWQSRLYTTTSNSHTSPNLRFGTTYTVAVTAVNRDDRASNRATYLTRTPTAQMRELQEQLTEQVKRLEAIALQAATHARTAADAALDLERLIQDDKATGYGQMTRDAEKYARWAGWDANDARSLHEEIDNSYRELRVLWGVLASAYYPDFVRQMNLVKSSADEALRLTEVLSKWASWSKLTAAVQCTAIQDRLVKSIYKHVSLGLTLLSLTGSIRNLAVKGIRALGEVVVDHLIDDAGNRIIGNILDKILPEDVRTAIGVVVFLDPPEPPTGGKGINVGCDYKDGKLYRVPLCSDLNWWDPRDWSEYCRSTP